MSGYLYFGNIFSKSESELAAANDRFAAFYAAAARRPAFPEASAETGGWMVHAMYFSMGKRHDYRGALKNVQVPVLVIHGEKDLQTETESRAYADAFPNATLQVIPDAGHFIFEDQPVRFAEALQGFLSRIQ